MAFTRALNEKLLRATAKLTPDHSTGLVVKDGARTWGHVQWAPLQAYEGSMGPVGSVLDIDALVDIANGVLPGVSASDGIDDEIFVDHEGELKSCTIVGIGTPPDEPGGDMLRLSLKLRE